MISINVEGIENLAKISDSLDANELRLGVIGILEEELEVFANILHSDVNIPHEYSDSLSSVVNSTGDTVILVAWGGDRWQNRKFGNRLEWEVYMCPKRKYFGGELAPEYSGPDYLKERWELYRPKFINIVKERIVQWIRDRRG